VVERQISTKELPKAIFEGFASELFCGNKFFRYTVFQMTAFSHAFKKRVLSFAELSCFFNTCSLKRLSLCNICISFCNFTSKFI